MDLTEIYEYKTYIYDAIKRNFKHRTWIDRRIYITKRHHNRHCFDELNDKKVTRASRGVKEKDGQQKYKNRIAATHRSRTFPDIVRLKEKQVPGNLSMFNA